MGINNRKAFHRKKKSVTSLFSIMRKWIRDEITMHKHHKECQVQDKYHTIMITSELRKLFHVFKRPRKCWISAKDSADFKSSFYCDTGKSLMECWHPFIWFPQIHSSIKSSKSKAIATLSQTFKELLSLGHNVIKCPWPLLRVDAGVISFG